MRGHTLRCRFPNQSDWDLFLRGARTAPPSECLKHRLRCQDIEYAAVWVCVGPNRLSARSKGDRASGRSPSILLPSCLQARLQWKPLVRTEAVLLRQPHSFRHHLDRLPQVQRFYSVCLQPLKTQPPCSQWFCRQINVILHGYFDPGNIFLDDKNEYFPRWHSLCVGENKFTACSSV